jgi:hypothetical protein
MSEPNPIQSKVYLGGSSAIGLATGGKTDVTAQGFLGGRVGELAVGEGQTLSIDVEAFGGYNTAGTATIGTRALLGYTPTPLLTLQAIGESGLRLNRSGFSATSKGPQYSASADGADWSLSLATAVGGGVSFNIGAAQLGFYGLYDVSDSVLESSEGNTEQNGKKTSGKVTAYGEHAQVHADKLSVGARVGFRF